MRPNLLFVFTDQQTLKAMSCAGTSTVETPNMDRLAAEGVRFLRSYCTSPVCGPSRASIVTGTMPSTHRLIFNHDERYRDTDADRLPSLADHLKKAGYQAYWIGKWHAQEFYPTEEKDVHGFHYLPIPGQRSNAVGLDVDSQVSNRALSFFKNAPENPWFLGISWHNPHDICYECVDTDTDLLHPVTRQGTLPPLPDNFEVSADEPDFIRQSRERTHYGGELRYTKNWDQTRWREYLRAYDRLTEAVDAELGRVLNALDANGLTENTLVVFTSDHGEGVAGHRMVVKLSPYEEAVSVPLIARLPGTIPGGTTCASHIASGLDLLPTFCDFAEAECPPDLPGQSLKPHLLDPTAEGRDFAVIELAPNPLRPDFQARLLVTRRFKFMAFSHGEPGEALYDLETDPGETKNRINDPALRAVAHECRGRLVAWGRQNHDSFF